MTVARLLDHFDRVSEAPGAVPRLRRFILDLAVRGRLVEQEPGDEPAVEPSHRIRTSGSEARGQDRLADSTPSKTNASFHLPRSWAWASLASLCISITDGDHLPPPKTPQGIPFLVIGNLRGQRIDFAGCRYVSEEYFNGLDASRTPRNGDILYTLVGSYGIPVSVDGVGPFCVQRHIGILRPTGLIDRNFLARILASRFVFEQASACATGIAQKTVPLSGLRRLVIPLAPVEEQHRIVTKIDELMALCDRLDAAQAEREARRDRVVAASLQQTGSPGREDIADRETASVVPRVADLATRVVHVEALRETLLELGATGRLTGQEKKDGTADTLLRRLPRTGNQTVSPPAAPEDGSYIVPKLPRTWRWTIVDQLASGEPNAITDGPFGANLKTEHYIESPGFRVIRLQNIGRRVFRDQHRSYITRDHFERLAKHHVAPGDLVVAGLVDPFVRCCRVPDNLGPAAVKADCYRFSVHQAVSSAFVSYYLNSGIAQKFAATHHHGMTLMRIGLGNFRQLPVPLPPIGEQHRIVAKLDELMSVCDRIEELIAAGETTNSRLLDALLHEALADSETTHLVADR